MSKNNVANTNKNTNHNYLNTQKSNAHTKVNGNLVQLWFGGGHVVSTLSATPKRVIKAVSYSLNQSRAKLGLTRKLALMSALALANPVYADLTITDANTATATDMANVILGNGVTINSASYTGGAAQSGTFVTGSGVTFGSDILSFTEGVIFSTGEATSVKEGYTGPSAGTNRVLIDAVGGIDGDPLFNSLTSQNSFDATWLYIDFTPTGAVGTTGRMTLQIVFGSEEYNAYIYSGFNDSIAIMVNGSNKALVPNGLAIGIDTINDASDFPPNQGTVSQDPNPEHIAGTFESANPSLYVDNKDSATFTTSMNGFTKTVPVTFDVNLGVSNTLKIGIADAFDFREDSWLFVKAGSAQTSIVAESDSVTTPTNVPKNINVLANDNGNSLSVSHISGQAITAGSSITLPSGIIVKLEANGTLTVSGTTATTNSFTYQITNGSGGTSSAFVNVVLTAPIPLPLAPTVVISDDINNDSYINVSELSGTVAVLVSFPNGTAIGDTLKINDGNGNNQTIVLTSLSALTVSFPAPATGNSITPSATLTNAAGEGSAGTDTATLVDTVIPTIMLTSPPTALKAGETATITFALSEASADFVIGDISVTGGTLNNFTGSGANYSATFTPTANSTTPANISVASGAFRDLALNANNDGADANNKVSMTINTIRPTVALSSNDTNLTAGETATITFTLSEASTDFVESDITLTGGTLSSFSGSGISYTATFTPDVSATTATVSVTNDKFKNAAGNTNKDGAETNNSVSMSMDTTVPTIAISSSSATLKAGETATITFTLSEASSDFVEADVDVTGGALSNFTGSGSSYTATFTPSANSTTAGSIHVASNKFSDAAGNTNTDGTDTNNTLSLSIDTVVPVPTIVVNDVTTDNILNTTEAAADVAVTGTVAGDFNDGDTVTISVDGSDFTGTVNSAGLFSINIPGSKLAADTTIDASVSTSDTAGNSATVSTQHTHSIASEPVPTILVNDITVDNILNATEAGADIAVTGTVAGDFNDGDTVTISVDGSDFTGTVDNAGLFSINVPGSKLVADTTIDASVSTTNTAGNTATGTAIHTHSVDNTLPTIAISNSPAALKAGETATITFTLSEASSDFVEADINVTGGALSNFTGSGTSYTATFTPNVNSTTAGNIHVESNKFSDAAGNINADGVDTNNTVNLSVDTGLPTIVLISDKASLIAGEAATITFTLSEASSDFVEADINVTGGTLSNFTGSGTSYTATFTPSVNSTTMGNISVGSSKFSDTAGNNNADGADTNNVVNLMVDTSIPSITLSSNASTLKTGETAEITFTLSEASINFDVTDIDVAGGTLSNFTGSGASYTATFTPTANSTSDANIHVSNDKFSDTSGNKNADEADTDNTLLMTIDTTAPLITANNIAPTSNTKPSFTGTTDQPDGSDVVVKDTAGNTLCNARVSAGAWTCEPSTALPYATHDLIAETTDAAGNTSTAPFTAQIEIDTDNDGLVNSLDLDDDNDGIPDLVEQADDPAKDTDGDGIIDSLDLDSDNDGILDIIEAGGIDSNNDGKIDNATDSDNDGLADSVDANPNTADTPADAAAARAITQLPVRDTDGDGQPDFQDVDSDNDSISDMVEAGVKAINDPDNNGMINGAVDANGIPVTVSSIAIPRDTDSDGVPDYRDLDSDNDAINDVIEVASADVNGDAMVDENGYLVDANALPDTNSNGIPDVLEPNNTKLSSELDQNGDGVIDDMSDKDGDGIADVADDSVGFGDSGLAARSNDESLETAVTGKAGASGPMGLAMMMLLLAVRRFGGKKLLQRFLPMLLMALFIVPSLMPSTAMANNCSASSQQNGFTACNYVAAGGSITKVAPEGKAGGFSTSDKNSKGYNVVAGRHFAPHWFAELGYTDMGEATLSNGDQTVGDETISYKVPSAHVGYLVRSPEKPLNFFVKGGLSAIQNTASSDTVPFEKQTNVQLSVGVGTQWQAKKSGFFTRLGVDVHDRDAIATSLTFGYKFGGSKPVIQKEQRVVKRVLVTPVKKQVVTKRAVKRVIVKKPVLKQPAKRVVVTKPVREKVKKPVTRVVRHAVQKSCFTGVMDGVNFHTNSAVLTAKAQGILKRIVKQINCWDGHKVYLIGHTDNVGSYNKNQSLSQRRAASVKAFLIKNGANEKRLSTVGKGETQPRASNKTKAGKANNRRVELRAL